MLIYYSFGFLLFAVFFVGHILKSEEILGAAVLVNGINAIYFFFASYRYPEFTQKTMPVLSAGSKKAAMLSSIDVPSILSRLEKIIATEEGFRDQNITVQSLSTQLEIQNHQLSRILKDYLGYNFRSYINQKRLEEAKRLLTGKTEMSIIDIAYAVGFNSKSSFNAAFSKDTGLTPSNYRKTALPTS